MLKMLLVNKTGQPYSVQDIRALQKKLREIEPELRREFLREVKTIGKEPEKAIRNAIPTESPLSGMNPATRGRNATLQWGRVTKGGAPSSLMAKAIYGHIGKTQFHSSVAVAHHGAWAARCRPRVRLSPASQYSD
jgi:hypothetical protein